MTGSVEQPQAHNLRTISWGKCTTAVLDRSQDEEANMHTLLQTATAFIARSRTLEADIPAMSLSLAPHVTASSQLLIQIAGQMLGAAQVGIAHCTGRGGLLRPLADMGLAAEDRWQWWARVQRVPIGTPLPREDRARLHDGEVLVRTFAWQEADEATHHAILVAPIQLGKTPIGVLAIERDFAASSLTEAIVLIQAMAKLAAQTLQSEKLLDEWPKLVRKARTCAVENNQMGTILGQTCHELKAPLTTMKLSVQLAERQLRQLRQSDEVAAPMNDSLAKVHELLTLTNRQIGLEDHLIDDLLDVTRIQSGRMAMHPTLCNLAGLVTEAVQSQKMAWPIREFHLDLPPENLLVATDAYRVTQVIGNYLTNALKYSPADQPIEVRLQVEDQQVRVSVQDHGVGLPKQETRRIWDSFYRVKGIKALNGNGVNLGLGLFICRTIIQQQHGKVGVRSAPGQGSTFWFTLPLTAPPAYI